MKKSLEQKLRFVKHGAAARADPRARLVAAFALLELSFAEGEFRMRPRSAQPQTAQHGVVVIFQTFRVLRNLLRTFFEIIVLRERDVEEMYTSLTYGEVDQDDLVAVMDLMGQATGTMLKEFRVATINPDAIPDDLDEEEKKKLAIELEHGRYKCAALLPTLNMQMTKVWEPLKRKILKI